MVTLCYNDNVIIHYILRLEKIGEGRLVGANAGKIMLDFWLELWYTDFAKPIE